MEKGLGKGLGALIPAARKQTIRKEEADAPATKTGVLEIAVEKIKADPNQPRKHFDHHALEELTDSIKEHGILQPLILTAADSSGQHVVIAGERRLRAAEMLGLRKVPVIIRDVEEHERLALALVENIQRTDLNPIEEALGYRRLMDEFNLTQQETAKSVGKSRSGIANVLRLLELPDEVQNAVAHGKISLGHAKVLASLSSTDEQIAYVDKISSQKLTVRELDKATQKSRRSIRPKGQKFDPVREAQEEMLRERLGTKVQIKKTGPKGQIVIHFYSLEELQRLLNDLT